jgi:hypothetical protein
MAKNKKHKKTKKTKKNTAAKKKTKKVMPRKVSRRKIIKRKTTKRIFRKKIRRIQVAIKKPSYFLNHDFEFFYELKNLIMKSSPAEKDRMVEKINKLGRVKLAVISGIFLNRESDDPTVADLLIVGDDIDPRRLRGFLRSLEAEVGKEIKFAIMDKEEFQYRLAMFDRFVRVIMEAYHEKLINRLGI